MFLDVVDFNTILLESEIGEEESDYNESDTDSEPLVDKDDSQSPNWNNSQLELLESALSSYKFLPRTTTEKVFTELQENDGHPCTRKMVRNWFCSRENGTTGTAMDRWEIRQKKLAICDHAKGSEPRTDRIVKFCEEVQVKDGDVKFPV